MKKAPKKIKILGHDYEVVFRDKFQYETDNPARLSEFYLKILIDNDLPQSNKDVCLFHELIEAINHHAELELPHQSITILGEFLYQIFTDNDLNEILDK